MNTCGKQVNYNSSVSNKHKLERRKETLNVRALANYQTIGLTNDVVQIVIIFYVDANV
jgi:hypothetical protein